jgi:hypothetical protein
MNHVTKYTESNPLLVRTQCNLLAERLQQTLVKFDIDEISGSKISAINPPDFVQSPLEAHNIHLDLGTFMLIRNVLMYLGKRISLADVKILIEQKRTHEMNYIVPWDAHNFAKTLSMSQWSNICLDHFDTIENHIRAMIEKFAKQVFAKLPNDRLATDVMYVPLPEILSPDLIQ